MRLLRSTAIIGSLTLLSRVLGLIRDVLWAKYLGASAINDALITAVKLPNLFRRMFAEGAFNAAFVPLYARRIELEGEEAAAEFAGEALSALFMLVAAIVIIFQLTMPWTLNIIGGGLEKTSPVTGGLTPYSLGVIYARLTMPYLLLMSMAALFSGVLNTRNYFAMAAFVPVLLNLVWISLLLLAGRMGVSMQALAGWLAVGMSGSGILQAGALYWAIKKAKIALPFLRPRLTPAVRRLFVLGVPGMLSAGITHINLMVSHSIATIQEGAASWLFYADRLYQLPLGMIGIAMGIALLPALSRRLRGGDESGAMMSMNRAMEIAALMTLPATMALAIMPEFLIGGLFERGRFLASDTAQVGKALKMFAYGLPAFVLLKILTPAFFARENTKTPMIYAALSAVINLGLGAGLFFTVGFFGLALATSFAAWVNVICLALILIRNRHFVLDQRLLGRLPRIGLAALLMGLALWQIVPIARPFLTGSILQDYITLAIVCGLGFAVYCLCILLLGALDMSDFKDAFKKPPLA